MSRAARLLAYVASADRTTALAIFLLALALRAYVATRWVNEPVWDAHYYHFGAVRISQGLGYSEDRVTEAGLVWSPWCHYPVGFSGLLGGVYAIFGPSVRTGMLTNAIVGALTAAIVQRIAFRAFGRAGALLAGLACALTPALVLYGGVLMTEPLAALGLVLTLYVFQRAGGRPWLALVAAGLVVGAFTLVRPQTILTSLALGVAALAFDAPSFKKRLLRGVVTFAVTTLVAIVTVLPWTARNCRVMDDCAFVSSNGGWNLAIGSSPRATGRFEPLSGADGCREVTGQVDQDRCWTRTALGWIKADPKRWIGLMPKKLSHTFDHQSFAVGYLAEAAPDAWPEPRRARYRKVLTGAQIGLVALAAAGVVCSLLARGRAAFAVALLAVGVTAWFCATGEPATLWPVVLLSAVLAAIGPGLADRARHIVITYAGFSILGLAAVHAVFFGEDRYQTVVTPLFCLLAGALLARRTPRPADQSPARSDSLPAS